MIESSSVCTFELGNVPVRVLLESETIQQIELHTVNDASAGNENHPMEAQLVTFLKDRLYGNEPVDWTLLRTESLTEFRKSVYRSTASVPSGETISYGELASRVGAPGAAQAVGQALRHNPFPIVVPCHRVIRSDGRTGGFGGKQDSSLKETLLNMESA